MAGFYAIARGGGAAIGVDEIWAVQELAALGTWRYTQGIYRIDPALIEHIAQTPIGGDLPCDALMHLPEWCMYIESPGQKFDGLDVHGFFAHLEYDVGTGRQELRLLLDSEDGLIGMPIHLGPWTLSEAVNRVAEEALKYGGAPELFSPTSDESIKMATNGIAPFISLLLFVLSQANDITRDGGIKPSNPTPKKVKGGAKLFPAEKSRTWDVGTRIGAALRRAYHVQQQSGGSEGQGSAVRPHIRRAHWHGYWLGPKNGPRKFDLRWLPPIAVNIDDVGEMPTTIRPVQ
jgi:hypothetical protein